MTDDGTNSSQHSYLGVTGGGAGLTRAGDSKLVKCGALCGGFTAGGAVAPCLALASPAGGGEGVDSSVLNLELPPPDKMETGMEMV